MPVLPGSRSSVLGGIAATAAGGAAAVALFVPSASAAPDPCAASEVAKTIASGLVDAGGTAIFEETVEMIGSNQGTAWRAPSSAGTVTRPRWARNSGWSSAGRCG